VKQKLPGTDEGRRYCVIPIRSAERIGFLTDQAGPGGQEWAMI